MDRIGLRGDEVGQRKGERKKDRKRKKIIGDYYTFQLKKKMMM